MAEIMQFVQAMPNARRGDLLPEWRGFVVREHSNILRESVMKDYLYRRLQNLMERKLVERDGQRYRLTKAGGRVPGIAVVGTSGQSGSFLRNSCVV